MKIAVPILFLCLWWGRHRPWRPRSSPRCPNTPPEASLSPAGQSSPPPPSIESRSPARSRALGHLADGGSQQPDGETVEVLADGVSTGIALGEGDPGTYAVTLPLEPVAPLSILLELEARDVAGNPSLWPYLVVGTGQAREARE